MHCSYFYPRLMYEFYRNLKIDNMHQMFPRLETKVCGTSLHINAELISEVTGISISHALGTPFPESMTAFKGGTYKLL
jgi:hypothetical protein